jgi:uncharacterized SAM-binding protein YcdF (DUF218 family)
VTGGPPAIGERELADAEIIWDYHRMHHRPRPCAAAIGLGSNDLRVAAFAARLYRAGLFPVLVFTGANSPTTAGRFPRGEAVHFTEHAMGLGVPASAIMVEPAATNTGQNICYSRRLLQRAGIQGGPVLLISKPYMERRAFATARKAWPEAEVVCASEPIGFADYLRAFGDDKLVIDLLVGDLQRIVEYPARGYAIAQHVPGPVLAAYRRLAQAGFDSRLLSRGGA